MEYLVRTEANMKGPDHIVNPHTRSMGLVLINTDRRKNILCYCGNHKKYKIQATLSRSVRLGIMSDEYNK